MRKSKKQKDVKRLICKYAHCEVDPYGSELCCGKNGSYCKFDRRDPEIDYNKCGEAVLVTPEEWENHARKKGW